MTGGTGSMLIFEIFTDSGDAKILIILKIITMKQYKLRMSYTVVVREIRVQTVIWNIRILWCMVKRCTIRMRKNRRINVWVRI